MQMVEVDVLGGGNTRGVLAVQFHKHPVQDEKRSLEEGRPCFVDVDYIRIMVPGDKTSMVDRPVRPSDMQEHRKAWEAYQSGQAAPLSGTPLAEWPAVTRGQVEELAYFNVRTVEQLAAISDGNAQNVGPILALRQKARDYIEHAKGAAPVAALRAELEAERSNTEALKRQMAEMSRALENLQKQKGR
jgi:hypothetical protein